jgi:anoctamin-8
VIEIKDIYSNKKFMLDKICKYFGIKMALYFAWLAFYTRALTIPAVLGLIIWLSIGKNETHDSIYFLVICGFNLIWGICFNDLWKQKCAEFSYKWGTLDMKEDLLQDPRPMFKGSYKPSKVTNKLEPV